jgi:hypothetical protein
VLDAVTAVVTHQWDQSLAWTDDGMRTPATWLQHHTSVRSSTARRQLRVGEFLARRPEVARVLVAGEITVDHVVLLDRIDLPRIRDLFDEHLDDLLAHARDLPADQFATVCRHWLALADQDGDDAERRRFGRRKFHLTQTLDGTWKVDGVLPDDVGAALSDELARINQHLWESEQAAAAIDPALAHEFTPTQRRADAFAELIRRGIGIDLTTTGTARPSVSVIIDEHSLRERLPATTESGHWLSGPSARQAVCDSVLYSITVNQSSIPIRLGRTTRLATPAQRKVIIARDRTCVWKGCDAPPHWCKVHHVDFWEHGGLTDTDNMCLLCDHHHTLVHKGGWTLRRDPITGDIIILTPQKTEPPDRRCRGTSDYERLALGFADPPTRRDTRVAQRRARALAAA